MDKVVVKKMSGKLIKLGLKKSKAESKASASLWFQSYFNEKREQARRDFWGCVREEFPELSEMDCDARYDNTLVFKPYKVD